ncbi:TIM barrel protein [Ravibacter arvi]|uniref:TIM barrel protein n=1 Tax=Ravibacter arvi TaxID=2051041 RepID=A0ABP8LML0_9BACT
MSNRRKAIAKIVGASIGTVLSGSPGFATGSSPTGFRSGIRHSVCKWCYGKVPLEDFCKTVKSIGIESVELLGPAEWPVLKANGLDCALPHGAGLGIEKGFNEPDYHNELVRSYEEVIPLVARAGYRTLICFSGNRKGKTDEEGLVNCEKGLKRLLATAEKHKVTLIMELLNSKVDHKDYQCDHTAWGVELCKRLGSDRFKLLYDIYHMQIMEGDVIRNIRENIAYIGHFHTGGVPGRNEIDATQELYYPAIMRAIAETGYTGYVGQEFIPKRDWLESLKESIKICSI